MGQWEKQRIGDVSVVSYGYTAKASFEETDSKFLRITDIQNDSVTWDKVPYCSINDSDFEKYKLVDGDIVFARTGATTGKSYLVRNPPNAVAASYLIRLRLTNCNILPEFVFRYFQTREYWETILLGISGSTQGGFNATKLSNLVIPIPPLSEQKRIVEILDEAFEGIDRAIGNTQKNLANARELFDSYLNNIFDQKGEDWAEKKLQDLIDISHGYAFKGSDFKESDDPTKPIVLTPGNYTETGKLYFTQKNTKRLMTNPPESYLFDIGDLTVVMTDLSSKMKILGKPAFIEHKNILHNQRIGRIIFKNNLVSSRYLFYFLQTRMISDYIKATATGTMVRHTAPKRILSNKIYLPINPKQQSEIVGKLDQLLAKTQRLEAIYQRKLEALQELKQSLLHKAFTGELTNPSTALRNNPTVKEVAA